MMKKKMKLLTVIFVISFLILIMIYRNTGNENLLPLAITFGTCAYHFLMRLIVGYTIHGLYHNEMNYHRKWFQPRKCENRLYKKLKVKTWKDKMPTYDADTFSFELHSMEEIVMAMCQSEVVHEINMVFSFAPLFLAIRFGTFWVFLMTSVFAAGFDMMFVIMQRYNRPRVIRLLDRTDNKNKEKV